MVTDALDVIRAVVAQLPPRDEPFETVQELLARPAFCALLVPNFEDSSFIVRPRGRFRTLSGVRAVSHGTRAMFLLEDDAEVSGLGWTWLATLKRSDRWRLYDIRFKCTACFGVGVLQDDVTICDSCAGSGWGVATCETIDVTSAAGAREPELVAT